MVNGEIRWRPPPILWITVILCLGFVFYADIYQRQNYTITPNSILQLPAIDRDDHLRGFLVKTNGCRIPDMHPFDKSIINYIKPMKYRICNAGLPPLVDANLTSLFIVNSSFVRYNVTEENLKCCYRPFWRLEPKENENDKLVKYSNDCVIFNSSIQIDEEYVKVECYSNDSLIYTDLFAFVPVRKINLAQVPRPLNVLIIGLDSVSRLNLHRQLPYTIKYLRKLGIVELLGYNKVGDNTFPNVIPILTGYNEDELKNICWPNDTVKFDKCPFIWKRFKEKNYKTVYAEDAAWMGIFNYMKRGFREQPTDYYWSFFNRLAEELIGNESEGNVKRCVGSRRVYVTMLDYLKKFIASMANYNQPYFGFFWEVSLTHDFLNAAQMADEEFEQFFKHLNQTGELNRTVVFFLSDHGIRWGGIRSTFQGRMEERLPFLTLLLPEWFRNTYHTAFLNLQKNVRRLTTPFDFHETLVDLLNPFALTTEKLNARTTSSRGYSLFSKIPESRTCEDAAISSHWCTCQQSTPIDINHAVVTEVAEFAVNYMNTLLEGYADCSNLTLNAVYNARIIFNNGTEIDEDKEYDDYMITLETQPGGGVFEVTIRKYINATNGSVFEVIGTVSRINLYGDQSRCVSDFHMKLYCYCKYLLKH